MNKLEFTFEESPWQNWLRTKQMGDSVSAVQLLTLLEEESEEAVEDALQEIEMACMVLDISDLRPAAFKVEMVNAPAASTNASLLDLRIGSLSLNPEFSADTDAYAVNTANATNTISAIPADAGAEIDVVVNDEAIANGTAAKWNDGANTVKINVTAADGTTTKTYTVTVTKA